MKIIDSENVNEIYNVAGGFEQKNIDTVKKIIESFYGTLDGWEKYVNFDAVREGQDVRYALNDRKLKNLGWEPKISLEQLIKEMIDNDLKEAKKEIILKEKNLL